MLRLLDEKITGLVVFNTLPQKKTITFFKLKCCETNTTIIINVFHGLQVYSFCFFVSE